MYRVQYSAERGLKPQPANQGVNPGNTETLKQIVDESTITGSSSSGAAYYADNNETQQENREPVYNAELGLTVERLPEGVTIASLWGIL